MGQIAFDLMYRLVLYNRITFSAFLIWLKFVVCLCCYRIETTSNAIALNELYRSPQRRPHKKRRGCGFIARLAFISRGLAVNLSVRGEVFPRPTSGHLFSFKTFIYLVVGGQEV